ncbi:MAG: patatin [Gemmatimonadetes bacterium]|nr:patatin [Gemmatimonadota bacterium]
MNPSGGTSDLALVLSGGGARASYQVGILAATAEKMPTLSVPILTGVSAGAINAAFLAGHPGPFSKATAQLQGEWLRITSDRVYHIPSVRTARWVLRLVTQFLLGRMHGMGTVRGVLDMRPLSRFLASIIDFAGIDNNIAAGRLKAVALTATSYATDQTVTFVQSGGDVQLWERAHRVAVEARITLSHVMASSAIPLIFPAVKLGGSFYGDGSVRQTAPLAPAIHLGARKILAISNRAVMNRTAKITAIDAEYPTTAQVVALLFNAVFVDSLDSDAERLEGLNRVLETVQPVSAQIHRGVRLLMLRPSRNVGELTEGLRPRLPNVIDRVVRGMGAEAAGAQEFLSYLLFEPEYTGLLMELGYEDALAQWETIERFLLE